MDTRVGIRNDIRQTQYFDVRSSLGGNGPQASHCLGVIKSFQGIDSIDLMSLLKKLRAMGTSKEAIEWFRSYLTEENSR